MSRPRVSSPGGMLGRSAGLALVLAASHCTLFTATDGFSGGAPAADAGLSVEEAGAAPPDGAADGTPLDGGADAETDADARILPPGTVVWSVNGHGYLVIVRDKALGWSDAVQQSKALGGHLATIGSKEENDFTYGLVIQAGAQAGKGPWLGGYQLPGENEPAGEWQWVTGEPWTFTTWGAGQPDNSGAEDYLAYVGSTPGWNDLPLAPADGPRSFIVELE